MRKPPSDDSIRTEFLEGPIDDHEAVAQAPTALSAATMTTSVDTEMGGVSDRAELIERIKRGESPTWRPSRRLEDYFHGRGDDPYPLKRPPMNYGRKTPTPPLAPSADLPEFLRPPSRTSPSREETLKLAAEIERPRSALHAGDFTSQEAETESQVPSRPRENPHHASLAAAFQAIEGERRHKPFGTSPTTPWYTPSPGFAASPYGPSPFLSEDEHLLQSRSRAPSLSSHSSSFIFRPPTSPLVQTLNNYDSDQEASAKANRRHTLPPRALVSLQSSPPGQMPTPGHPSRRPAHSIRRESTFPYQAHQPRRSLTLGLNMHPSSPQTPTFRSRRPSLSSDASPLHHAPMVGSYEESILRGRMSTVPSKPLHFMAQIGVLGLGNCKPQLRCPAHVSVPFPAVFYSYGKTNIGGRTSATEDGPSPYVGLIDLENSLDSAKDERRLRVTDVDNHDSLDSPDAKSPLHKRKRRSASPRSPRLRVPPGGSYRIPQKGQLQIVIKNPNKTAVKLFLVPYDLTGMEAGTRTFIRQRSYSTGPILEVPVGEQPPFSSADRPTLRYLIHLHMCCPSRGRFYLYKSIRVVFANRVPDGKEKLRNEIQLPDPRWSAYRPSPSASTNRDSAGGEGSSPAFNRRRSGAFGFDGLDGISPYGETAAPSPSLPNRRAGVSLRGGAIPFALTQEKRVVSDQALPSQWQGQRPTEDGRTYHKLNPGDLGYGGNSFTFAAGQTQFGLASSGEGSTSTVDGLSEGLASGAAAGLLAKKLRGLDVQRDLQEDASR